MLLGKMAEGGGTRKKSKFSRGVGTWGRGKTSLDSDNKVEVVSKEGLRESEIPDTGWRKPTSGSRLIEVVKKKKREKRLNLKAWAATGTKMSQKRAVEEMGE